MLYSHPAFDGKTHDKATKTIKFNMTTPVKPEDLIGDDWMEESAARAEFEKGLDKLDEQLKPITDAFDASERLSEEDWAVMINARD